MKFRIEKKKKRKEDDYIHQEQVFLPAIPAPDSNHFEVGLYLEQGYLELGHYSKQVCSTLHSDNCAGLAKIAVFQIMSSALWVHCCIPDNVLSYITVVFANVAQICRYQNRPLKRDNC